MSLHPHLNLSPRQRQMLGEMGIRLWMPPASAAARQGAGADAGKDADKNAGVGVGIKTHAGTHPNAAAGGQPTAPAAAAAAAPSGECAINTASPPNGGSAHTSNQTANQAANLAARTGMPAPAPSHAPSHALAAPHTVAECTVFALHAAMHAPSASHARWMVVADAAAQTASGEPGGATAADAFAGHVGRLLEGMLAAIGLSRQAVATGAGTAENGSGKPLETPAGMAPRGVLIACAAKGGAPGQRQPPPEDLAQCGLFLAGQVALVRPHAILAMGRLSAQALLQTNEPVGRLRGRIHRMQGVPVAVTYAPAYLLRNPSEKAKAWQDLCLALDALQNSPPDNSSPSDSSPADSTPDGGRPGEGNPGQHQKQ